jgi:hypothetical protein
MVERAFALFLWSGLLSVAGAQPAGPPTAVRNLPLLLVQSGG